MLRTCPSGPAHLPLLPVCVQFVVGLKQLCGIPPHTQHDLVHSPRVAGHEASHVIHLQGVGPEGRGLSQGELELVSITYTCSLLPHHPRTMFAIQPPIYHMHNPLATETLQCARQTCRLCVTECQHLDVRCEDKAIRAECGTSRQQAPLCACTGHSLLQPSSAHIDMVFNVVWPHQ